MGTVGTTLFVPFFLRGTVGTTLFVPSLLQRIPVILILFRIAELLHQLRPGEGFFPFQLRIGLLYTGFCVTFKGFEAAQRPFCFIPAPGKGVILSAAKDLFCC